MGTIQLFLVALTLTMTQQGKILLVPGMATSHCMEMMSIGEELLKRGHQVTVYSMLMDPKHCFGKFNTEPFKDKFKVYDVKDEEGLKAYLDNTTLAMSASIFRRESIFTMMKTLLYPVVRATCGMAFVDKVLLNKLRNEKYDIALVEGVPFTGCLFGIPRLLDIPSVAVGSFIDFQDSRTTLQTSTFPSFVTEYSNDMCFHQRLINLLLTLVMPVMRGWLMPTVDLTQYDDKLAGLDSNNLIKDSVLFIENSDYIVDYPKAIYPNFVQAGALTANPAKPLPADLKKILDGAKDGIVLVTFGSMIKNMPEELKQKLLDTFGRLKNVVLFKQDRDEVKGNVRIMKWLPQNDILGHPNTKLFISHCGKNGFWESVYHGVPIICMAIHAETYTTKVKVRKYGIGSSINIFDDTVDQLVQTINDVLGNENIARNMKMKSTLLRDRAETPRQRAASAIEHVLKYGGDHMRPPSVNFNFFSYSALDVWCSLFAIVFVVVVFDIWIIKKCCCRSRAQKTKTD